MCTKYRYKNINSVLVNNVLWYLIYFEISQTLKQVVETRKQVKTITRSLKFKKKNNETNILSSNTCNKTA